MQLIPDTKNRCPGDKCPNNLSPDKCLKDMLNINIFLCIVFFIKWLWSAYRLYKLKYTVKRTAN